MPVLAGGGGGSLFTLLGQHIRLYVVYALYVLYVLFVQLRYIKTYNRGLDPSMRYIIFTFFYI